MSQAFWINNAVVLSLVSNLTVLHTTRRSVTKSLLFSLQGGYSILTYIMIQNVTTHFISKSWYNQPLVFPNKKHLLFFAKKCWNLNIFRERDG